MSYTNTWDDTIPPDTGARNQVALFIRNVRVDLQERFNDQLVVDTTTDPWVLQPKVLGNVTGKWINLHWSDFIKQPVIFVSDVWNPNRVSVSTPPSAYALNGNGTGTGNNFALYATARLPDGVTVTEVDFWVDPAGGSGTEVAMYKQYKGDGSVSAVFTPVTSGASGYTKVIKSGLTELIDNANYTYFLMVVLGDGNSKLYSASVIFDVPDCRNTL